ncbi:MAG TPA: HisA/HisF-related TIM barrel protein, partial [Deltaproteobacteria bacterium]|nr:HisA/HisF-related TIM barrel protein [Deltaproteobacteria bacterium]
MIVIPAVDLYQGKVVRLARGDYNEVTVYSDDPVAVARSFEDAGAGRIHVVDLDAAAQGRGANLDAIGAIARALGIEVELGGGIRTVEDARRAFDLGVKYVILGTVCVRDPSTASSILEAFPGRVAIGIDALGGRAAITGWKEVTSMTALDLARHYEKLRPAFIVFT